MVPIENQADPRWVWTRRDLLILSGIVAVAVAVRWAILGAELVRLDDPDGYLRLARSLIQGEGLRINGRLTAYRPPLYPILLAPWVAAFDGESLPAGLAMFHLALGASTVALVADSARRWGLPRLSVWVAATVAAVDPVLAVQSRALMTETLAAFLVAATLWGISFRGWPGVFAGGVGFGLASLCRPSLLPAAGLTAMACLMIGPGKGWQGRTWRSLLLPASTLVLLSPWAIRNALVFGEPIWTTTHGGYTLALANNPAYYADVLDGPPGAVWSGPNQEAWIKGINAATAGLSEPEADRFLRRRATEFARAHPRDFSRASWARLGRFWGVMPSSSVYPARLRWASAAWTAPVWALVLIGLGSKSCWRWPRIAAPALLATLTLVHTIYWTDLRMRAPLVPALALVAATGFAKARDRTLGRPLPEPTIPSEFSG